MTRTDRLLSRLTALAISAVMTVAMLGGVNHLATSQPDPALVAKVTQTVKQPT
jgi:hypothetical protein